MQAYYDFYTGSATKFAKARAISKKYTDYPMFAWRLLFLEMQQQLRDFDGEDEDMGEIDNDNEDQFKKNIEISKKLEPSLTVELEKKDITIEYLNIPKIDVKFYIVDLEIMFSRTPFLKQVNLCPNV
jgi:hypothetical protein